MGFINRIKNGWDAFMGRDPTIDRNEYQFGSSRRPDRVYVGYNNVGTIVSSIFNKIAVDCAQIDIRHVKLDDDNKYFMGYIKDSLDYALTYRANIDQTGRALMKDVVYSLLDTGSVAIVPTLTEGKPWDSQSFKIIEIRVAKIVEWYPNSVRVDIYNDHTGQHTELTLDKSYVAIVENPFYQIMNERSSTIQRLKQTINQVTKANQEFGNDKFNLIIQTPYPISTPTNLRKQKQRIKDLEEQLDNSRYGIGWVDSSERVIQLNRSIENNLWSQVRDLQADLINELGFTQSVFDGTANEQTMLNYNNRTIEPILSAITEAMECKWLSKTAISQHQGIRFYRDPFKLVPTAQIAEIADKFTRNEILTSNELRSIIGFLPASDPKADELRNSNLNHPDEKLEVQEGAGQSTDVSNPRALIDKALSGVSGKEI